MHSTQTKELYIAIKTNIFTQWKIKEDWQNKLKLNCMHFYSLFCPLRLCLSSVQQQQGNSSSRRSSILETTAQFSCECRKNEKIPRKCDSSSSKYAKMFYFSRYVSLFSIEYTFILLPLNARTQGHKMELKYYDKHCIALPLPDVIHTSYCNTVRSSVRQTLFFQRIFAFEVTIDRLNTSTSTAGMM